MACLRILKCLKILAPQFLFCQDLIDIHKSVFQSFYMVNLIQVIDQLCDARFIPLPQDFIRPLIFIICIQESFLWIGVALLLFHNLFKDIIAFRFRLFLSSLLVSQ